MTLFAHASRPANGINIYKKSLFKREPTCYVYKRLSFGSIISMPFSLLHMHRGSIKTSKLLTIEMNMLRALHYTLTSKGSSSKGSIVQSMTTIIIHISIWVHCDHCKGHNIVQDIVSTEGCCHQAVTMVVINANQSTEYASIMKNGVWEVVPRPEGKSVVTSRWLYKIKYAVDGSIEKYKARFVARGFSQIEGVDYGETSLS